MEPSGSAQPVRALALLSSPMRAVGTRLSHPETDVTLNVEEIPLRGSFLRHAAALSLALGGKKTPTEWPGREVGSAAGTGHGGPTALPGPKSCPVSGLGLSPPDKHRPAFPTGGLRGARPSRCWHRDPLR